MPSQHALPLLLLASLSLSITVFFITRVGIPGHNTRLLIFIYLLPDCGVGATLSEWMWKERK